MTDPFLVGRKRRAPVVSNQKQNFITVRLRPIGALFLFSGSGASLRPARVALPETRQFRGQGVACGSVFAPTPVT